MVPSSSGPRWSDTSIAKMLLKIAIASSYDGLYDLKSWRNKGIIDEQTWQILFFIY